MLKIQDLRVSIDSKQILKGVSLEVKPGEIHAVMGPNGSGKSTLAYALAGHPSYVVGNEEILRQSGTTQGSRSTQDDKAGMKSLPALSNSSAMMNGEDLLSMSPDERSQAGLFLAFQYPVEVPGVRVEKFLRFAFESRFPGRYRHEFGSVLKFRGYLETICERLEVKPELLKRGLNEGFSGGEKKRLEVLQMALLEPKFAVLDETDSGLDIDAIKAVATGVNSVVEESKTGVVVVTHYKRILEFIKPDKIHVLVAGEIVESGGSELVDRLEEFGYKDWQ